MAKRIAKFHKVSFEQFQEGWTDTFGPEDKSRIQEIYDGLPEPQRALQGTIFSHLQPLPLSRGRR